MYYKISNCEQSRAYSLFAFSIINAPIPVAAPSKRGSAAARFLGLGVRVPPENVCLSVGVVCCQAGVSVAGESLLHRSPTESGLSDSV